MTESTPIGYWLKLVDQLIDKQFVDALEEHGITRRQWQLLGVLARGPASMLELASALGPFLDTAAGESVTDHVAELVESEWVLEEGETYTLTERGLTAHARITVVVDELRARSTDEISLSDYETAIAVLERMAENLGWRAS